MNDFVDYVEYTRPDNAKVRVAFEMLGSEVLFYFCEYQHSPTAEWKLIQSPNNENIQIPTKEEIEKAQQLIVNKYNILSI